MRGRQRQQEKQKKRGGSAVSGIEGCEEIFYKDLDIVGNVLSRLHKYADVCRCTGTTYMPVNPSMPNDI
jgi:hypothetical protein